MPNRVPESFFMGQSSMGLEGRIESPILNMIAGMSLSELGILADMLRTFAEETSIASGQGDAAGILSKVSPTGIVEGPELPREFGRPRVEFPLRERRVVQGAPACLPVAGNFRADEGVAAQGAFDYRYVLAGNAGMLVVQRVNFRADTFDSANNLEAIFDLSYFEVFRLSAAGGGAAGGRAVDLHQFDVAALVNQLPQTAPSTVAGLVVVNMEFGLVENVTTNNPVPLNQSRAEEATETYGFQYLGSFPAAGQGVPTGTTLRFGAPGVRPIRTPLTAPQLLGFFRIDTAGGFNGGPAAGGIIRCRTVTHRFAADVTRRVPPAAAGFNAVIRRMPPQNNYA